MAEITYQIVLSTIQTVGLLVGIFYYITTMRNAQKTRELTLKAQEHVVETRQAQLFMQILTQFNQPIMTESRIFHQALELNSLEDYMNLFEEHETNKMHRYWGTFAEGIGVLVRENYLDIKVIAGLMGALVKTSWEKLAPYIQEMREKYNLPRAWIEWEYLYNALMKYAEENPERSLTETENMDIVGSVDRS